MASISTFSDNFDTGSAPDAGKWPTQSGSPTLSSGQLVLASGTATTVSTGATTFTVADGEALLFQATSTVPGPNDAAQGIGIYLAVGTTRFGWVIYNGTTAQARSGLGGTTNVGSPRTHAAGDWYRIIRSGGNFVYEFSTDGLTWTTQASVANAAGWDLGVLILGHQNRTAAATIDNVNNPPVLGLPVKQYNGSTWEQIGVLKAHNGTDWVKPKYWNGTAWT